jgi:hypothetical protein
MPKLFPNMRTIYLRIVYRGLDREMILERNLSLHNFLRVRTDVMMPSLTKPQPLQPDGKWLIETDIYNANTPS